MLPTVARMTARMSEWRRKRRACAWLGGVALLCNVLATLVLGASSAFAEGALAIAVICTAAGAKPVPAAPEPRFAIDHCAACPATQFVLAVCVAITAAPAFGGVGAQAASANASQPAVHLTLGGIRSRAPPASV
jgi:hypothetical protein